VNGWVFVAVAAVLVPIVLLLSFAGCAAFTAAEDVGTVEGPPLKAGPPPPPPTPPPPNNPAKYNGLVLDTKLDLISYWPLAEASSTSAAEDAADLPKNHGSYVGPHSIDDGVLRLGPDADDTAPRFDGVAGHVEVAYDTLLNPASNSDFSVEAWIKPSDAAAARRQVIVSSYRLTAAGAIDRGFIVELLGGATPRIRARTAPDGSIDSALPAAVSGWYHVVLTYQASTKTLRLYINLQQPAAKTGGYTANRRVAPADVAPPLRIGAGQVEPPTAATPPGLFFAGSIDNVALYRGVLSAAEIQSHFDAARTP
jgi:hypothetical protein